MNHHELRRQKNRELHKAQRRQERAQSLPLRLAVGAVATVLIILLVIGADFAINANKIHYGVKAGDFKLGGKSKAAATKMLNEAFKESEKNVVKLEYEDSAWEVSPATIGMSFDSTAVAEAAYSIGREGKATEMIKSRFASYFKKRNVALITRTKEEQVTALYNSIREVTDIEPVDSKAFYTEDGFVVEEGSDGKLLDTVKLDQELPIALIRGTKTMKVPVPKVRMAITLKEAEAAVKLAEERTNTTTHIEYENTNLKADSEILRRLVSFVRSDLVEEDTQKIFDMGEVEKEGEEYLIAYIDPQLVSKHVIPVLGVSVGKAPVNARFQASGGTVKIIPSETGIGADPFKLSEDLVLILESGDPTAGKVKVVTHAVEPELSTEKAKALNINTRISTYTTSFSSGNKPRVNNIHLLADAIDGKLIAPGESFSLNQTVGKRTADKGYQEAGAIVGGKNVPQLGGGICQVNSTLFNTILLSGMQIDKRKNHSYYISSYPLGRDATVSWDGPDFVFTNNFDFYVLLATSHTNNSVTVEIYGTDPGYTIDLKTSEWRNIRPYPVQEVSDPALPAGTKVVEQSGVDGGTVVLTRTITKKDGTVETNTFTSNYVPRAQIVRVGTKAAPPPAPAPTPTPPPASTPTPEGQDED